MTNQEYETVLQRIEKISNSDSSTEEDGKFIQLIAHKLGFEKCVVVCGIAYLEGKGTIQNPPASIHQVAKSILKALENIQGDIADDNDKKIKRAEQGYGD